MNIIVNIPDSFQIHYESDKFKDSLFRLKADIHCAAGLYELELCDMLIEAFDKSEVFTIPVTKAYPAICPKCLKGIFTNDKFCSHCGAEQK